MVVQNVLYMMWSVVMYSVTFRQLTSNLYQVPARLSALILQHQPLMVHSDLTCFGLGIVAGTARDLLLCFFCFLILL